MRATGPAVLKGLSGRTALVTGGASGIGLAVVRRLLAEGSVVGVLDRDQAALDAVVASDPDRALALLADVSDEEAVRQAFDLLDERFGPVELLHNNAGIEGAAKALADAEITELERLHQVNVRGSLICLREFLRRRTEAGAPGNVVNTASGTALATAPTAGLYAAGKAAVITFTKTAAIEYAAEGIRLNAIAPGPVRTPLFDRMPEDFARRVEEANPQGRVGTPEEVAAAVAWLLSDECPYLTGAVVPVDGGETA